MLSLKRLKGENLKSEMSEKEQIDYLLGPLSIKERAQKIFDCCCDGKTHFKWNHEKLNDVVELVYKNIKKNFPSLEIPFHSRWRHFNGGEINRIAALEEKLENFSPKNKIKSKLDLVFISVLLDAGAGPDWKFKDPFDNKNYTRSEGLALASLDLFLKGTFSSDPLNPYQVDAKGLFAFSHKRMVEGFQVSEQNPLVGADSRRDLLTKFGEILNERDSFFFDNRPGGILDFFEKESGATCSGPYILKRLLKNMNSIWPHTSYYKENALGDVWSYGPFGEKDSFESFIPFHKLSQWLSYSLMEPLIEYGIQVTDIDELTGLAEYRNGGLLLDSKLLELRNRDLEGAEFGFGDDIIIEWRALTIIGLDLICKKLRKKMNVSREDFPLVKALEGGTWKAGRELAFKLRADGSPPIKLKSDGTVF